MMVSAENENMQVQTMTEDDVQGICRRLGFDAFDGIKYVNLNDFGRAFGSRRIWLVAMVGGEGGKPAGVASMLLSDDGKSVGLWNLSVSEKFQGRGYGRALAEAAFDYADINALTLNTGSYTKDGETRLRPLMEKLAEQYPAVLFTSGV